MTDSRLTHSQVDAEGDTLELSWDDGLIARFHAIWLRDNAHDEQTRDPGNGQRLITVLDVPADCRISHATLDSGNTLSVTFQPEGKSVNYDGDWLRSHHYDNSEPSTRGWLSADHECWDANLGTALPSADFANISEDVNALREWLAGIRRYGVATLSGVPTSNGALTKVVDLFGYVRETNYGRWFEVRSQINPINLAYTGLALTAHTDNPYRDPVPTLQILACLQNSTDGGDSIVVDGFMAARVLQSESAEHFAMLSEHCANFEFSGADGVCLRVRRPMIELGPDGELLAIRYNNRSQAAFTSVPFAKMADYYVAYRHFAEIINRESMEVTFKMTPGDLFIVDNTRVMHARKGFSSEGSRWLQGCYADKDSLYSKLTVLEGALA